MCVCEDIRGGKEKIWLVAGYLFAALSYAKIECCLIFCFFYIALDDPFLDVSLQFYSSLCVCVCVYVCVCVCVCACLSL